MGKRSFLPLRAIIWPAATFGFSITNCALRCQVSRSDQARVLAKLGQPQSVAYERRVASELMESGAA